MRYLLTAFFCCLFIFSYSQDPSRFAEEVEKLLASTKSKKTSNSVIFAGSSTFRLWDNLETTFPDVDIVNHGFGGSQTSDLICYSSLLITNYNPSKVFIYEGDNDLAEGKKSVDIVVADVKTLIRVIRRRLPDVPIYIVSPKPSISRWNLKEEYVELNEKLAALCPTRDQVTFVNVWDEMVDQNGELKEGLFIEDGLHLNESGYEIWAKSLATHLQ